MLRRIAVVVLTIITTCGLLSAYYMFPYMLYKRTLMAESVLPTFGLPLDKLSPNREFRCDEGFEVHLEVRDESLMHLVAMRVRLSPDLARRLDAELGLPHWNGMGEARRRELLERGFLALDTIQVWWNPGAVVGFTLALSLVLFLGVRFTFSRRSASPRD